MVIKWRLEVIRVLCTGSSQKEQIHTGQALHPHSDSLIQGKLKIHVYWNQGDSTHLGTQPYSVCTVHMDANVIYFDWNLSHPHSGTLCRRWSSITPTCCRISPGNRKLCLWNNGAWTPGPASPPPPALTKPRFCLFPLWTPVGGATWSCWGSKTAEEPELHFWFQHANIHLCILLIN